MILSLIGPLDVAAGEEYEITLKVQDSEGTPIEGITLSLGQSLLMVRRAGEEGLFPPLALEGEVLANVAFGQGEYGETTLYLALLAVPPFTSDLSRGLVRFELGLSGLPLLP